MSFAIHVEKEKFKFNCAHFVAFKGFRERLHGHNYQVGVTLYGAKNTSEQLTGANTSGSFGTTGGFGRDLGHDGYLLDFSMVKEHATKLCKEWNERVIIPVDSDVLSIDVESDPDHLAMTCVEDGARFLFPKNDCLFLPIKHSTAEEMAMHFTFLLVESLSPAFLEERRIMEIKVSVGETINQLAWFRLKLKDYPTFKAEKLTRVPSPCLRNDL